MPTPDVAGCEEVGPSQPLQSRQELTAIKFNDQVHAAGGPMGLNVEQPETVNEGNDVEKPKREPAPVQRLGLRHSVRERIIDFRRYCFQIGVFDDFTQELTQCLRYPDHEFPRNEINRSTLLELERFAIPGGRSITTA